MSPGFLLPGRRKDGKDMMKISFQGWETKCVEDLQTGDVFTISGRAFIKTDQPGETRPNRVKAVDLSTGEMNYLGANVHVHPVEAELIVR